MNAVGGDNVRALPREVAKSLPAGSEHYTAYVGPPEEYDLMAATQFRLLTALGLREHHFLLDFGCGSLRAGRLFIPYLLEGRYSGLEPNRWLIDDVIDRELGQTLIELKRPTFLHHCDFSVAPFGRKFDYILAQSIFSHAGRDLILRSLVEFRRHLNEPGLILATFVQPHQLGTTADFGGSGWVYPGCVSYSTDTVFDLIEQAGLAGRILPWFHPRQTWYAIAHCASHLPPASADVHLSGAVLDGPKLHKPSAE